jgi:DNA-binding CsgD family transcriptional regulator/PAS domain-containing protein
MSDEAALSHALAGLYGCVVDPDGWPAALAAMTAYVGGSSAMLFHQDRLAKTGNFIHSHNTDPEWTRLYFERYVALNPVLPFTAFMDVGSTTSFSRIIDGDEFRASRFYREWAAPQRYLDVVVTIVDKSATAMGLFAVTNTEDDGPVSDAEIRRMELLAPHVRRALGIARLFDGMKQQTATLASAIDLLPEAVFFLDADMRVQFANRAAKLLIEAGEAPLRQVGTVLGFDDAAAAVTVKAALRAADRGDATGGAATVRLRSAEAGKHWVGSVLPIAGGERAPAAGSGSVGLLFVRRLGNSSMPALDALVQLYGFTPRELQVFVGVVQFGSVPEAARVFGLSPTTVRSHLQRIFDKTGVRRQADLIRIAASMGPPDR